MTLIVILLALGLERVLGQVPGWGRPVLFLGYVRGAEQVLAWPAFWRSWVAPVALIVPPVALVWWIGTRIENPFVDLGWSAVILLLCLGPRDLADDVHELVAARAAGNEATSAQLSRALLRGPATGPSGRTLIGALFIQSHERLFGVLLWFFVIGPPGAVAYRIASRLPRILSELAPDSQAQRAADLLHNALAFIPARVTALLYGLAGSLDDATREWRRQITGANHEWRSHTWALLAEVSAASLGMEEPGGAEVVPATLEGVLAEVLRMQRRALLILLAFFAFFATGSML
jgi:membrane protein required for beta-lactamase induction